MNEKNSDSDSQSEPTAENIFDIPEWETYGNDRCKTLLNGIIDMATTLGGHIRQVVPEYNKGMSDYLNGKGPHYLSLEASAKETKMMEHLNNLIVWGALVQSLKGNGCDMKVEEMEIDTDGSDAELEARLTRIGDLSRTRGDGRGGGGRPAGQQCLRGTAGGAGAGCLLLGI